MKTRQTIRVIALFEGAKGALVLALGSGLLAVVHKNLHEVAVRLVEHAHLNPAAKYPHIFIEVASNTQDSRILLLAAGAALYALVRFVEAYGLFLERTWAEALAAVSGALYVPFEVHGLVNRPGWLGVMLLCVNLAVVAFMLGALSQRRRLRSENSA
ncbi:MAG: DUF2127 domain-containing protein [Usitatibacter sp.]